MSVTLIQCGPMNLEMCLHRECWCALVCTHRPTGLLLASFLWGNLRFDHSLFLCVVVSRNRSFSADSFFNVLFSVEFDLFSSQPTLFVCALLFLCRHVCGWLGDGCGWACVTWHVSFMQFVVSYYWPSISGIICETLRLALISADSVCCGHYSLFRLFSLFVVRLGMGGSSNWAYGPQSAVYY